MPNMIACVHSAAAMAIVLSICVRYLPLAHSLVYQTLPLNPALLEAVLVWTSFSCVDSLVSTGNSTKIYALSHNQHLHLLEHMYLHQVEQVQLHQLEY